MTFNGVMAVTMRYFTEAENSGANYVKVVRVRPVTSATEI